MNADFFKNLPRTKHFFGVIDGRTFSSAPDNWLVVVADIRGSTSAVAEGRYKQVNMIGGAVISAVLNAADSLQLPYVFGGDGATILIPAALRKNVEMALVRTRSLARNEFDLALRIGFVPIKDIRRRGLDVLVARYEMTAGNDLAAFGGGGVELAESLVKAATASNQYIVAEYEVPGLPDLSGLSCRWEPLHAEQGRICCILVKPIGDNFNRQQRILRELLSNLVDIIGSELDQANPVSENSLNFHWPPSGVKSEALLTRADKSYLRRYVEILMQSLIQWVLEQFDRKAGNYDAPVYREELQKQSDFCKYDDVLRMVLDCTPKQIDKIRALLARRRKLNDIDFGIFETDQALITCLVFDLETSQHVHFVDGDHGGFSAASMELKQQQASKSTRSAELA